MQHFPTKINRLQFKVPNSFSVSSVNSGHLALNSLQYVASKIWHMDLLDLKSLKDLEMSKSEIRNQHLHQFLIFIYMYLYIL